MCKICHREYTSGHYRLNRDYYKAKARRHDRKVSAVVKSILNEAKSKPCSDCGVAYPPYVMDFDHVRGKKLFVLSRARKRPLSLEVLFAEMSKCDVVCANCHRERTHSRAGRSTFPYT